VSRVSKIQVESRQIVVCQMQNFSHAAHPCAQGQGPMLNSI